MVIAKVTCEEGSTGIYSIPQKINGYPVISIDAEAFKGVNVNTVYFPRSIERIKSPVVPYQEQGALHFYVKSDEFYFDYTYYDSQQVSRCYYKDLTVHCPEEALELPSSGDLCGLDTQLLFPEVKYEQWDG